MITSNFLYKDGTSHVLNLDPTCYKKAGNSGLLYDD